MKIIKFCLFFTVLTLLSIINISKVNAQILPQGFRTSIPSVGGIPMTCRNALGGDVILVVNNSLNDIGRSYPEHRVIQMNSLIAARLPNSVLQFWYAHECGHHALPPPLNGDESRVDCWAVRMLRDLGLLPTIAHINLLISSIYGLSGDYLHLFGPQRAALIASCYASL